MNIFELDPCHHCRYMNTEYKLSKFVVAKMKIYLFSHNSCFSDGPDLFPMFSSSSLQVAAIQET